MRDDIAEPVAHGVRGHGDTSDGMDFRGPEKSVVGCSDIVRSQRWTYQQNY
jgi:hypothetical protein